MKILVNEANQKLAAKLQSPIFKELILLMETSLEALTLRQIKEKMMDPKIEKILDDLIKEQVVLRENKRYYLNLAVVSQTSNCEVNRVASDFVLSLANYSNDRKMLIIESMYQAIDFETPIILTQDIPIVYVETVETDLLKVISFTNQPWAYSLPNYFKNQELQMTRLEFSALDQLLGDVDPIYFLDQVFVIVEKIIRGERIRKSIFLTALEKFGYVGFDEKWLLRVPVIQESDIEAANLWIPSYEMLSPLQKRQVLTKVVTDLGLTNKTIMIKK